MTWIHERNWEYWWKRLSPTQQQVMRDALHNLGQVPFGTSIATVRVLRRNGYAEKGRLTSDGHKLVRLSERAEVAG